MDSSSSLTLVYHVDFRMAWNQVSRSAFLTALQNWHASQFTYRCDLVSEGI